MNINDKYTKETTKVAELKDCFGITRFKIALTDFDDPDYPAHDNLMEWDATFQVTVVSFCVSGTQDPVELVNETYSDYEDALKAFNHQVIVYRALVKAESKGWQDIHIYDDQVHYRTIDPDCCKNCIFAAPVTKNNCLFNDWKKHKAQFHCTNPNIAKVSKEIDPNDPRPQLPPHHHDGERVTVEFDLAPIVYEDGICDDYKRGLPLQMKMPGQSMKDFIKHSCATPEGRRDTELKYEVNRQLDDRLQKTTIAIINGNDNDKNQNNVKDDEEQDQIIGGLGA